jgi:type II secretory pathway component PulF
MAIDSNEGSFVEKIQDIIANPAGSFDGIGRALKRMQFGSKAQLAFLEDLHTLVADGIPPNRAIEMMTRVTTGISRDVAYSLTQKISEGQPLADGMREWFAINIVEIIRVGEEGGALAQTMKSAINSLGQSSSTLGALMAAIIYPLMVIIMACAIMIYLNTTVFMQFKAIKPMSQWPQAGRTLVNTANFIQSWWWLAILALIVLIFIMRKVMANYSGELRPLLDKVPPFSFYRQMVAARFLETLGLLVSNGVVFKNALKVMQYQANPYLASHLIMMEHLLSMGRGNVADVLSTGLVKEEDVLRLRVMAEVKGFEHGLVRMGVVGGEQLTKTLKTIGKIIGGILLAVGAILIIIIVKGIFLTGMSMGST